MKRKDVDIRIENNKRASDLIYKAEKENLTVDEINELKAIHTGYGGIGDNTQYFTPKEVVNYMIGSLKVSGFKGGSVLEPSCGNGIFINELINNFEDIDITGVELNFELSKLNKICYPSAHIIQGNTLDYSDGFKEKFDLIIGNPPFGKTNKNKAFPLGINKLEAQFVELALDSLKPDGHFIMVLPTSVLNIGSLIPLRQKIMNEFVIMQSIQLPDTTFYKSGTSVNASILHLRKKSFLINDTDHNYSIMMACIDNIGWNKHGHECNNDLLECLDSYKNTYSEYKKQIEVFFKGEV